MRRKWITTVGAVGLLGVGWAAAQPQTRPGTSPADDITLPEGFRSWQIVSVAHEAGKLNDIRATFGNDIAVRAFRDNIRPFPDGAIILRLAWTYTASAENDAVFAQPQSFVAGEPTNIQVEIKNATKYARTGGWGYAQFENGRLDPNMALAGTCYACHAKANSHYDLVFTHYAQSP